MKRVLVAGATFLNYFQMRNVIPKSLWPMVSHIVVTHGDPDHYWYTEKWLQSQGRPW